MMQAPGTVYIAEDETLAREALVQMFSTLPQWQVVGAGVNGRVALADCTQQPPDVLVTDIQMPLLDGLELAAALRSRSPHTQVVFVTAYDRHAVRAFRLAAVDYLLKPIADREFHACVTRLHETLQLRRTVRSVHEAGMAMDMLQQQRESPQHLVVRSLGRVDIVPLSEVMALRADGNYVSVLTQGRTWLHRETLKSLSERLDPARFMQIHRSAIVAVAHVRGLERTPSAARLTMSDGTALPVGASFLATVAKALGI